MGHRLIGYSLLQGKGLEVGAFHRPAQLAADCSVIYCDVQTRDESLEYYPELDPALLATVDAVADLDKEGLEDFDDEEFDFVIFNNVVSHLANPIRAIGEIFRVVKPRGLVVISAHDKSVSFDKKRPSPSFEHLLNEYQAELDTVAEDHYEQFLMDADPKVFECGEEVLAKALQTARLRREHAHTWDSTAFREFLDNALAVLDIQAVRRYESMGQENKNEYFAVLQKYQSLDNLKAIVADSNRQFERVTQRLIESRSKETALHAEVARREAQRVVIQSSRVWRYTEPLRRLSLRVRQVRLLRSSLAKYIRENGGLLVAVPRLTKVVLTDLFAYGPGHMLREAKHALISAGRPVGSQALPDVWKLVPVEHDYKIDPHKLSADVIVCVHNALEDVARCLSSLIRYTLPPYRLILIDDGSSEPTRDYLKAFAMEQDALLVRNETARGYTFAANQGLHIATGEYAILLNSDTIVTPDWLNRMVTCAESDRVIGMVGPLSNTASWQSVPELELDGDWASNPLPEGVSVEDVATLVACHSARIYPRIPFLNGFCLLIKRSLIEAIGYFDEKTFGRGYGEENDYCLRARRFGWQLAVADDVYIFHAQSRSYSNERRKELCELAGNALAAKHGPEIIDEGVAVCRSDRVLDGLRSRARILFERRNLIERGLNAWEGKRVLFVLPVMAAGGGANVVVSEARAMIAMGVDVWILNLEICRAAFEDSYPELDVPVTYAERWEDVAAISTRFDAVVATANHTVKWLVNLRQRRRRNDFSVADKLVIGYYIQDFEPYFYPKNSHEYRVALDSYSAIPGLVRFTKTEWNRDEVLKMTGKSCAVIGPSFEVDEFMPRSRHRDPRPSVPLRICAMVRPSSERREPLLTMKVLRRIQHAYADRVEIVIFGVRDDDQGFLAMPRDFSFFNLGTLTPAQMAALLNEIDIFADFSTYQAMGLTAMEAMSCGAAVIVPKAGGSSSFAVHEGNALMIDNVVEKDCYRAVERLVVDAELRRRLQRRALSDVVQFYPEKAANKILEALFGGEAAT